MGALLQDAVLMKLRALDPTGPVPAATGSGSTKQATTATGSTTTWATSPLSVDEEKVRGVEVKELHRMARSLDVDVPDGCIARDLQDAVLMKLTALDPTGPVPAATGSGATKQATWATSSESEDEKKVRGASCSPLPK